LAGGITKHIISVSIFLISVLILNMPICANDATLGTIKVRENHGVSRNPEYVEITLQLPVDKIEFNNQTLTAADKLTGEKIPCQIFTNTGIAEPKISIITIIFPVSIKAHEERNFLLQTGDHLAFPDNKLSFTGENLEITVENDYYRADLTRSSQSEAKNHSSGQLSELLIKLNHNVALYRTENRMHWAPNFQKTDQEYYETIAGWENPQFYKFDDGPYLIRTERSDRAPDCPEINLTAVYSFYAGVPYFRFYSSMIVMENVWLKLLRNDEMTMDSLFTHVAFQRPGGEIEDLAFSSRYERLKEHPLENEGPWLCFYNAEKGYALGSIRLKYDIDNDRGYESPVYHPHTKISDGAGGGKYWNRRLIDEKPVFVPGGSRYIEENAYIVFSINDTNKFEGISSWAEQLRNPLIVSFISN
jgi:hypothetical protein